MEKPHSIVAVSGGVDSMVLLHMLMAKNDARYVVAHFNHGIRKDSHLDQVLVERVSKDYGLTCEVGYGHLKPDCSEARARQARYKFLHEVQKKYRAKSIITAHHEDDRIETAILNLQRGTGRRGLSSLQSSANIERPLLKTSKAAILGYATKHQLEWREDSTNQDIRYKRNRIRQEIMPMLTVGTPARVEMIKHIDEAEKKSKLINRDVATLSRNIYKKDVLFRSAFCKLPHSLAKEVLIAWLRDFHYTQLSKSQIERLTIFIKTGRSGTQKPLDKHANLQLNAQEVRFVRL